MTDPQFLRFAIAEKQELIKSCPPADLRRLQFEIEQLQRRLNQIELRRLYS